MRDHSGDDGGGEVGIAPPPPPPLLSHKCSGKESDKENVGISRDQPASRL